MRRLAAIFLLFSLALPASAQDTPAAPVPSCAPQHDRPVDDYIEELRKSKSKSKHRNKSLLPDCILGWCRERRPEPAPEPAPPPQQETRADPAVSSSKSTAGEVAPPPCLNYDPILAAHNVEVGDQYFEQKNYRAARSRYAEGLEYKPGDPAIHLRLARTLEKLEAPQAAVEHYRAAAGVDGPWKSEAQAALARLAPQP